MKIDTNLLSSGIKRKSENRDATTSYFEGDKQNQPRNKRIKKGSSLAFECQIENLFTTSSKSQKQRSKPAEPMDLVKTSYAPISPEKAPSSLPFKQRTLQKTSNLRNIVLFRNFAEDSQKKYNKLSESNAALQNLCESNPLDKENREAYKEKAEIYQHGSQMAARLKRQCLERIKDVTDYGYMN